MKTWQTVSAVLFLTFALGVVHAQDDQTGQQPAGSGQSPASGAQQSPDNGQASDNSQTSDNSQPAPAVQGALGTENPPISGLDQPSFESRFLSRSYLVPGAFVNQSINSNVTSTNGQTTWTGVTHVLGSLALQKLWSRYNVSLDYVGGGVFYNKKGLATSQVHQMDLDQRYLWRTGQFDVRDSFSYLPQGSFGYGAYGGAGALNGIAGVGGGGLGNLLTFFGPGQFAALGQAPRVTNTTIADVSQYLSPRSSFTLAGSYGLVHFTQGNSGFLNSNQISAQAGYNYQISRRDQLALLYGYQSFGYPSAVGISFNTHLINAMYGHQITGRLHFVIGAGPQIVHIQNVQTGSTTRISAAGQAALHYKFPKTLLTLSYDHYSTNGSGLFVGATTDLTRLAATRPLSRKWTGTLDLGYTHNHRVAQSALAVPGQSFNYLYSGVGLARQLGRDFGLRFSYQFNDQWFDATHCGTTGTPCSTTAKQHVALFGIDWHPRPIRLD